MFRTTVANATTHVVESRLRCDARLRRRAEAGMIGGEEASRHIQVRHMQSRAIGQKKSGAGAPQLVRTDRGISAGEPG